MYNLKLNEAQMRVIEKALDFYSRILCGQIEEVDRVLMYDARQVSHRSCLYWHLEDFKKAAFPELGVHTSYAIGSPETPEGAKIAYDIQQVVRHVLAWDIHPEGGILVSFQEPEQLSKEPLPKAEAEKMK